MTRFDERFTCMGTEARILLEDARAGGDHLERQGRRVRDMLASLDRRLSRFDAGSELSRLNASPLEATPASSALVALVRAGRWAAERSGGLVDFTLVAALERQGYVASWSDEHRVPLAAALGAAPARRPALPDPASRWRSVLPGPGLVRRPPNVRIDSGGIAKGLAADLAAKLIEPGVDFTISCGGDMVVGGPRRRPQLIAVERAAGTGRAHVLELRSGGVATSGLHRRVWRRPDGSVAHHVLDPSTGEPAWTGLLAVTAVGATALDAETLAKHALLAGPRAARRVLRRAGGVLQHEDSAVEVIAGAPRLSVSVSRALTSV
jgi:thiamine biosynthesis lipoprotein